MSETALSRLLQLAAIDAQEGRSAAAIERLSDAHALFSSEVARLKASTLTLQEELRQVNRELAEKGAKLAQVNRYLANVLRAIGQGILLVDLEGTIVLLNPAGASLLQAKEEEASFRRYWELFRDDLFGFSMEEALRYGISHPLLYKTVGQKELEISTSFLGEGPKNHQGLIVLLRDVSELQKWQRIAARNDRMKELGEMAAKVAHEIRNPLGGIRGFAALLFRDLAAHPQMQEMAGSIIEGAKALEKLVSNVLHYARPIQIERKPVELGVFLKQIAQFIKVDPAFPDQVKMELHIPHGAIIAPIDPEAMKSALLNLLFNALQAMPTGGVLRLTLVSMGPACQIGVSDTGMGIDEEAQKQLFSPFFTTKVKGNGLGLVEAQKIVQAHNGTIEVRSQKGQGATFVITLPMGR
jgi:signal transduction histidine kinase